MQVSVIIPLYNSEKHVNNAIISAIDLPEVEEIVLVDDGSTDRTRDVCKKIIDSNFKVKYYIHEGYKNLGAGPSRNLGIKKAKCDYVAFLDSDDIYQNNRFEKDKYLFTNNPKLDFTINCVQNEFKSEHNKNFFKEYITINKEVDKDELFRSLIGIGGWYGNVHLNGITIKRKFIDINNTYFSSKLRLHQDTLFLVQIIYYGNFTYAELEKPVSIRMVHNSNRITVTYKSSSFRVSNKIKYQKELTNWALNNNVKYSDNIRLNYLKYALKNHSNKVKYFFLTCFYYLLYVVKKRYNNA